MENYAERYIHHISYMYTSWCLEGLEIITISHMLEGPSDDEAAEFKREMCILNGFLYMRIR